MPSSVSETLPASILKPTMLLAHTAAYNKTQILHRDISAGNILITKEGTGILIDWDMSKKVKVRVDADDADADAKPRRHSRTVSSQSNTCYAPRY
jgi:RIO-like serine/threonine protein kinase